MITNTGKNIIAKYLIGTAPSWAAYLALGCGSKPRPQVTSVSGVSSSTTLGITTVTVPNSAGFWIGAQIEKVSGTGTLQANTLVSGIVDNTHIIIDKIPTVELSSAVINIEAAYDKTSMDFEMFRVPISSKGYINDNGVNKIILTAELPTEERYEISEIGLYSAGSNSNAGQYDSKTITAFADTENWQHNDGSTISSPTIITASLVNSSNVIESTEDAIQTNANNAAFLNSTRAARYERCRYLNNVLMLKGDNANIGSSFTIGSGAKFLQLTGQSVDFSRNSTADLLKIAFSLISVDGNSSSVPEVVRLVIEFANSDGSQYARFNAEATDDVWNFSTNRYIILSKRLDELEYNTTGPTFSWNNVSIIKIYTSVLNTEIPTDQYYVALDAIRLDNIATVNPLYGLTGYTVIQNTNAETITKSPNTNNYIEFRVVMDVGLGA